jgi:dienelactone hydrolase
MRRVRGRLSPVVVLTALIAIGASLAACSREAEGFYERAPADLAQLPPGALIASERVTDLVPSLEGSVAHRVMYRSEGALGGPVATTGMVLVPSETAPEGGWPVVAWGHGTSGVGDACTPSKYPNLYDASSWTGYADLASQLVAEGYVVVAPDYEGLGTPGMHTYLDAEAEGDAMIDGVLAARELVPDAGTRWAAVGHSQGGQGAIAAGELAGRAEGLTFVGAVAFAPAQHLEDGIEVIADDPTVAPYLGYMAAGMRAIDPSFDYARFLGPTFLDLMPKAEVDCYTRWFTTDTAGLTLAPGAQLDPGWSNDEVVQAYFDDTVVGRTPGQGPVLVLQGTDDGLFWTYQEFLDELCAGGTTAQGRTYADVTHTGVLEAGWPYARKWLGDRFAGKPATGACGA